MFFSWYSIPVLYSKGSGSKGESSMMSDEWPAMKPIFTFRWNYYIKFSTYCQWSMALSIVPYSSSASSPMAIL